MSSTWNTNAALPWGTFPPPKGCDECNRRAAKAWPIFTVNYHGEEVCAKCLTPMRYGRARLDGE